MGAVMVDRNIAYLGKRSQVRHILGGPRVDTLRVCRITLRLERNSKCPVHAKTDCLDTYVKYDDAVNEVTDALARRQL